MIKTAEYIKSLEDIKDEPEALPQILCMGRSNVGKSSFINSLCNRKNLARISNTPGKTLLLNFYLLNENFYLVFTPRTFIAEIEGKKYYLLRFEYALQLF